MAAATNKTAATLINSAKSGSNLVNLLSLVYGDIRCVTVFYDICVFVGTKKLSLMEFEAGGQWYQIQRIQTEQG